VDLSADRKIVLVTRRTRLEDLIAKYHTLAQAKFYVEHLGADFSDYEREHAAYVAARGRVAEALEQWPRRQVIDRGFLTNFLFARMDIVIALGQDGLVANTMKYLDGQPLIGVNPDPRRYDGVLLPFRPGDLGKLLPEVSVDRRPFRTVTMAKAALSDGQALYAVNDLFIGPRSHTSALYEIELGERKEMQSSSGIIVSTGLGSTAWMKSVVAGSIAISEAFGLAGKPPPYKAEPWNADALRFAVREPFPSQSSQATLIAGRITVKQHLVLRSRTPEGGVIFSDGIETDRLDFNSGAVATIGIAEREGRLIV
jgi:NAD kinase